MAPRWIFKNEEEGSRFKRYACRIVVGLTGAAFLTHLYWRYVDSVHQTQVPNPDDGLMTTLGDISFIGTVALVLILAFGIGIMILSGLLSRGGFVDRRRF